ncbi:HD domain-containing protein [Geomonas sp. RF6]|uniref:HD-GYP domain-containing protein n=1 Tax=Geomonas sp. RF6 TaxID=2897342 RepID=UPI001E2ABE49|nr:HD domain-containing phosphohydrolase [Geomonas sp. RF6]UFS69546.1 HD domain-containing protein [Geomonas sp. RF6]
MKDHFWRAISTDSIDTDYFPAIPLFMKTSGNYVLYKDAERQFTTADRSRMERTGTQFMYVRAGDMQEISKYLEEKLKDALSRDDIDSDRKAAILYQTSINYVIDVFEDPEEASNLDRSRTLVNHLMAFVATDAAALRSIGSIVNHNFYIFAHSAQVAALNLLAHDVLFNVDPDELTDVGVGSLLHDFGMTSLTGDLARKADSLADIEYYKLKRHAQQGYEDLKATNVYGDVALTVVRHHHERYDGDGYPAGLKGNNIPRSAQLSALCDTYSSLTLGKVKGQTKSHDEAVKLMLQESGKGFNPELLSRFVELVNARKE